MVGKIGLCIDEFSDMGRNTGLPVEPAGDGGMDPVGEIDEDVRRLSHGWWSSSKFVVEPLARPDTLVGCGEGERLAIAIEAGICNEIELL